MREPALLRVAFVGPVAIGEQYRPLRGRVGAQGLRDVLAATTLVIGEADLVTLAIDGPEVAPLHLARAAAAGLDRGLVHGLDPALANRLQLRGIDRFE